MILGISCYYHDAAACLLVDGKLIAAAEEERFTRKKHDSSFPVHAIEYCLQKAGVTMKDVEHVVFYEKPLLKFERLLFQHIYAFPKSLWLFVRTIPHWLSDKLRIHYTLKKLKYRGPVYFIHHHLAHAAASYLGSPFEQAAICTVDGVGEWTTTAVGYADGNKIELKKHIQFPHSLGLLYSAVTAYLGFSVNNSEYKVMGLAPHGNPEIYKEHFKKLISWKTDGSYRLDMSYFDFHWSDHMFSSKFLGLFGPQRKPESELLQKHKDIAASLQWVVEEILMTMLNCLYLETRCENLVMGGGVALNSVANGKILSKTPFKNLWIHPNATDGGSSIGAAWYLHNVIFGQKRWRFSNPFLGPSFTDDEVKNFLETNRVHYHKFASREELIERTADIIWDNKVVGWFQGGMEWGPRALGARSILSNPCNPDMREILNLKVKHREPFRPFAPVVCHEDALTYFECDTPIPEPTDYMLMVYPIRQEYREKIPSVTHVDGSGRLQTIRRELHPLYYDLIKSFGRRSGIPILINTSFNIRGEPIVCAPFDAFRCMMGTEIDCLVMGSFLIWRHENLKDSWDSEVCLD
ncbi:hypothetical protein A3H75_00055 [Candidatus Uhrbacteria bacterium RIFCSPLOWO2_02_FULL_51_9]|uniref:Carbamoyltransferase n=1 Tax=Candidatus Uhrbacteria bacterium RIFCSPLOWO2_02_FULL_51_9 TaxID=1802410 RepID=A0A1F7VE48_9BACT|nr:MAG: hypothetical protein A3H75_00055 [Candidatus Uhrbacteria bacterium RIFCSPLOWO2_02_FULL_51_9]